MTDDTARIRVTLGAATLELEGSPEWISQYDETVQSMLGRLTDTAQAPALPSTPRLASSGVVSEATENPQTIEAEDFGEVLLSMPKNSSATDQMLLAGLFAQRSNPDNSFVTRDASALLLAQGVKIGNPSQSLTNNLKAKRLFKVASGYRVARSGVEYLDGLRGPQGGVR